jgi:hypothetical protein
MQTFPIKFLHHYCMTSPCFNIQNKNSYNVEDYYIDRSLLRQACTLWNIWKKKHKAENFENFVIEILKLLKQPCDVSLQIIANFWTIP